jgi:hypothetical protein
LTGAFGLPLAWLSVIYVGGDLDWRKISVGAPLIVQAAEVAWWSFQYSEATIVAILLSPFVVMGWFIAADTGVNFFDDRGYSGSRFFAEASKSQEVKVGCIFFSIGFLVLFLLTTPLLSVVGFLLMELTHYRASRSQIELTTCLIVGVLLALALSIVGLVTVNAFETEQSAQKIDEGGSTSY